MGKKSAHITLAIFDIVSIFLIYWVVIRYQEFNISLINNVDTISFNNRFFAYVGALIAPIAHSIGIIEATAKTFYEQYIKNIASYIFISLTIFFIALPFIMSGVMKSRIESASYHYCEIASKHQKLSSELVYVKDIQLCTEVLKNYKPVF